MQKKVRKIIFFLVHVEKKQYLCRRIEQNNKIMKKLIIFAFAVLSLIACNKQQTCMENKAIENIMTRVSVREFTGEKISAEQVETLLRAAMAAPSAINKQPWAFIVITDDSIIAKLGEALPYSRCSNKPACAFIPCGDLSKAIPGEMGAFWINDVSAATENLLLAAHAMGLGAVWTGLHPDMNRATMVQQMLGLPEHIIPLCVVPVGIPAEHPEVKDKFKPENIHYNGWE